MIRAGRRIVLPKPTQVHVESYTLRTPRSHEVLVKTHFSLVSNGTERTALQGNFDPHSHWAAWVRYPFRPGYACAGTIVDTGSAVNRHLVGLRVVLRAPHQSLHVCPLDRCIAVPDALSFRSAVWFALARIALLATVAIGSRMNRRVVIIGGGVIGQLVLRWLIVAGVSEVRALAKHEKHLNMFLNGGAQRVIDVCRLPPELLLQNVLEFRPDVLIDCTADPDVLTWASYAAGDSGTIVLVGDPPFPNQRQITSPVLLKGLTIRGIHDRADRDTWPQEKAAAYFFASLLRGEMDVADLQSHSLAAENAEEAYNLLQMRNGSLGIILEW